MFAQYRLFGTVFAAALSLLSSPAAMAQEACTTYTVQEGDTLGSIAQAAYGAYDYQRIFNANREVLSNNLNNLPVGTQLILPCLDGRLTPESAPVADAAAIETSAAPAAGTSGSYNPPVRVLSANGWAAFTDESLPGGGMFVRLMTTALQRAGNSYDNNVSYVDDVVSHIETLLPSGAFDVGIAWDIEDCTKADLLPDLARKLCLEYDFSDPIYEIVYGYATLPDNAYANARSYQDFAGARMCRPAGWASSDILRNGLAEPLVTWLRPEGFNDCFDMLLAGEIDVYAMDVEFIAENIRSSGKGADIVINPSLAEFMPQGFVVHKSNRRSAEILAAINAGLLEMRDSGEWYEIVSSSLEAFNNRAE